MSNENQRPVVGQEQSAQQPQPEKQAFSPSSTTLKASDESKETEKREEGLTKERETPTEAKPETDQVN